MTKPFLILMARWPAAGRCKTRLSSEIGSLNAANIQIKLSLHTFTVAKELEEEGLVEIYFSISGLAPKAAERWKNIQGMRQVSLQGEGNLGLKMRKQILFAQKGHKASEARPTIILGTDLPDLCRRDLTEALEALKANEIVLGPSKDGGYWLIGLSSKLLHPVVTWPFNNIDWGTNRVLSQTIYKAKSAGASYYLISEHNDIDRYEDLNPWLP